MMSIKLFILCNELKSKSETRGGERCGPRKVEQTKEEQLLQISGSRAYNNRHMSAALGRRHINSMAIAIDAAVQ